MVEKFVLFVYELGASTHIISVTIHLRGLLLLQNFIKLPSYKGIYFKIITPYTFYSMQGVKRKVILIKC